MSRDKALRDQKVGVPSGQYLKKIKASIKSRGQKKPHKHRANLRQRNGKVARSIYNQTLGLAHPGTQIQTQPHDSFILIFPDAVKTGSTQAKLRSTPDCSIGYMPGAQPPDWPLSLPHLLNSRAPLNPTPRPWWRVCPDQLFDWLLLHGIGASYPC